MGTANASGEMISIGDAFITAVMGYAIVFAGMILLIWVILLVSKILQGKTPPKAAPAEKTQTAGARAPSAPPAPGSAGEIKLHNVSERDAAMVMAVTAHHLGKPLNELRFVSIREIPPEESRADRAER